MDPIVYNTLIVLGIISTFLIFVIFGVFGKLIRLQMKRWVLSRRGYVEVEHISETNVRTYFIAKPKDHKFDFQNGFYHYIPEALTKGGDILKKYPKEFYKKYPSLSEEVLASMPEKERHEYNELLLEEKKQYEKLASVITSLNFHNEALTYRFGMPVITYYGDNPDPFKFSDRKKIYGSGVIKDLYLRLLLTQRYKDFKMLLMVFIIALCVFAAAAAGLWMVYKDNGASLSSCIAQLNHTMQRYDLCVNNWIPIAKQNSTVTVT